MVLACSIPAMLPTPLAVGGGLVVVTRAILVCPFLVGKSMKKPLPSFVDITACPDKYTWGVR
jgi:hypothetical protein